MGCLAFYTLETGLKLKREQKSAQMRQYILDQARQLFLRQGFGATTMRQIGQAAGVTTGSLYHFFEHKDAVFLEIVRVVFTTADMATVKLLQHDPDPYLNLMMELGVQVKTAFSADAIAGLYLAAHHSPTITAFIIATATERNRQLFGQHLQLDDAELRLRTLLVKGCLTSLIEERVYNGKTDVTATLRALLTQACRIFDVEEARLPQLLSTALQRLGCDV